MIPLYRQATGQSEAGGHLPRVSSEGEAGAERDGRTWLSENPLPQVSSGGRASNGEERRREVQPTPSALCLWSWRLPPPGLGGGFLFEGAYPSPFLSLGALGKRQAALGA